MKIDTSCNQLKYGTSFGTIVDKSVQKPIRKLYKNMNEAVPKKILDKITELRHDGVDLKIRAKNNGKGDYSLVVHRNNCENDATYYFMTLNTDVKNSLKRHVFERMFLKIDSKKMLKIIDDVLLNNLMTQMNVKKYEI